MTRGVTVNLQTRPKRGDDAHDLGKILQTTPTWIVMQEIGGRTRSNQIKRILEQWGYGYAATLPTPAAWDTGAVKSATTRGFRLSKRTWVGVKGPGPAWLRAKKAIALILTHLDGSMEIVVGAHLAPAPQMGGKRERLHTAQVNRLAEIVMLLRGEYPGADVTVAGDLNAADRRRLDPLVEIGLDLGEPVDTHGKSQLDYICDPRPGTRRAISGLRTDHDALVGTFKKEDPPVTRGFCPFAVVKNIPPGVNDPPIVPRLAILHVDAGNAESLYDYFKDRSGGVESHFHVQKDGGIEQYRSIYWQADANLEANGYAVSIETQGFGEGEWTVEQLDSIKHLLTWLHGEAGIPLRKVQKPTGAGVGYHVQFGAPGPWTPVAKTCPGPKRIQQFDKVLVPWMRGDEPPPPGPTPVQKAHDKVDEILADLRAASAKFVELDEILTHANPDRVAAWRTENAGHEQSLIRLRRAVKLSDENAPPKAE